MHALIIDDDKFNLEVLQHLLKAEGVSFTALQDPSRLLSILESEEEQIDIVFLDLEMPKFNGYQIFEMIRENLGADVPIIACTVHLNEVDNARELGFNGFMAKPLDRVRFKSQFARLRDNQPVWDLG